MASSDEEEENLPVSVENYYFQDNDDEPISFAGLPVQWTLKEGTISTQEKIFLLGFVDNKLKKIHKQVVAWKFDLSNVKPEISVLLKDKTWIKLETPRKIFEEIVRSILVTVQCLHVALRNPESSGKFMWDEVTKNCSSFEVRPSENDLVDHISLISEAVKRYDALAKSKFLEGFLNEKPGKRRLQDEEFKAKSIGNFIVSDSDDGTMDDNEPDEDDDDGAFDSVCAICDNGGDMICCEGSCLRSFHAVFDKKFDCATLGLTKEDVNAMQQFFCQNCHHKQHQCYACGQLNSSDKHAGAEVFQCVSATCGYFYHPHCVSRLIHAENKVSAEELEEKIAGGGSFTCPAHKCCVCKQGEDKKDRQLQFAVCRRCPDVYHRKCLPKEIAFEGEDARAWEGLLSNRILIYCLKHEIDSVCGTPSRDHLKFPGVEAKRSIIAKTKTITQEKRPNPTSILLGDGMQNKRKAPPEFRQTKKPSSNKKVDVQKSSGKFGSESNTPRKVKVKSEDKNETKPTRAASNKSSLGNRLFERNFKDSEYSEENIADDELEKSSIDALDADSEKRVLDIMKEVESSVTIEDIKAKLTVPSSHGGKTFDEKSITYGKVETTVEAVKEALSMIEEKPGSIEEAGTVCNKYELQQLFNWRRKFKIYLAPFLHGMRYTSHGRHFTKPEILKEIVDRLHCYVKNGDIVVDFCCGSNDFSILMKKKLEETGKRCRFKNFDIFPAKDDFNFQKRDWLKAMAKDIPEQDGSKLIMGLNPPFGVNGSLANCFIDKALEFKPKLLILIVPVEAERLEKKQTPYDLVWLDDTMLNGKTFYLPGSVDAKDNTIEQWNKNPPPLYLWSRPDWTDRHKSIAKTNGHFEFATRGPHLRSSVDPHKERGGHSGPTSPDPPSRSHSGGGSKANDGYTIPTDDVVAAASSSSPTTTVVTTGSNRPSSTLSENSRRRSRARIKRKDRKRKHWDHQHDNYPTGPSENDFTVGHYPPGRDPGSHYAPPPQMPMSIRSYNPSYANMGSVSGAMWDPAQTNGAGFRFDLRSTHYGHPAPPTGTDYMYNSYHPGSGGWFDHPHLPPGY